MAKVKCWVESMRLRTLPVSTSGVVVACGYACAHESFRWVPAVLCLVFAVLAQIASNFANEYFDFKNGLDKKGRAGFRRGVTEGDISPDAMKKVVVLVLAAACAVGCGLIPFGGWKLIPVGALIAVFALAYSAGPYPLSRIGLGDVAVLVFFGLVPVCLTFYLQTGYVSADVVRGSIAIGLLGVNVLVVNNYRDVDDDRQAGKRTTVVRFGRPVAAWAYLLFGFVGVALTFDLWAARWWWGIVPAVYLCLHVGVWAKMRKRSGSALNPLLGATARNMLLYTFLLLGAAILG